MIDLSNTQECFFVQFVFDMYANLADKSNVIFPVHQAKIIWNGEEREVNDLRQESDLY